MTLVITEEEEKSKGNEGRLQHKQSKLVKQNND